MREVKHCARCGIEVVPANWYRLVTGWLLCGKCYHETSR